MPNSKQPLFAETIKTILEWPGFADKHKLFTLPIFVQAFSTFFPNFSSFAAEILKYSTTISTFIEFIQVFLIKSEESTHLYLSEILFRVNLLALFLVLLSNFAFLRQII